MNALTSEERSAAREAAQAAVDTATSWDYSASPAKIADKLREGLHKARVAISSAEFDRLVTAIENLKSDETAGTPRVTEATPVK